MIPVVSSQQNDLICVSSQVALAPDSLPRRGETLYPSPSLKPRPRKTACVRRELGSFAKALAAAGLWLRDWNASDIQAAQE